MKLLEHLEHVTKYFYDNPTCFYIYSMESDDDTWSTVFLPVDTEEDLERFRWMVKAMDTDHLNYTGVDVINLYYQYLETVKKNRLE